MTDTSSTPSAFGSPVEGNAVTLIVVAPVAAPVTVRRSEAEFSPESDADILSVAFDAV